MPNTPWLLHGPFPDNNCTDTASDGSDSIDSLLNGLLPLLLAVAALAWTLLRVLPAAAARLGYAPLPAHDSPLPTSTASSRASVPVGGARDAAAAHNDHDHDHDHDTTTAVLAAAILADLASITNTQTVQDLVSAFPGQTLAIAFWLHALLLFAIGLALDAWASPARSADPASSPGKPAYRALVWIALFVLATAPSNLRLLWIECEASSLALPQQQQLVCDRPRVVSILCSYVITILIMGGTTSLMNEHRLRVWLISNDKSSKERTASLWSYLTFSWFDDIIALGYDKPLDPEDLNNLLPDDQSKNVYARFVAGKIPHWSLVPNLLWLIRDLLLIQSAYATLSAFLSVASPFFLRRILRFVQDSSTLSHPSIAILYAFIIFACTIARSISDGQMYFLSRRMGLNIRCVVIMSLYHKSIKPFSRQSPDGNAESQHNDRMMSGQVLNLMAFQPIKTLEYLMYLWSTPLQAAIALTFLYMVAGVPGLAGAVVMVLVVPLGSVIGKVVARKQKELLKSTDMRMAAINELLQGIRIIKFFAWEPRFNDKIGKLRENELSKLWAYVFTQSSMKIIWIATHILVSFLTFTSMTLLAGQTLDAATAFTALSIFNLLRVPVQSFPDSIVKLTDALVDLRRIEAYLGKEEIPDSTDNHPENAGVVQFTKNASFSWYEPPTDLHVDTLVTELHNITLKFPQGGLTVICGPTGGGKSSLLMALLGELHAVSGGVHLGQLQLPSGHLPIAFASQQVWLQNATIRENICFGTPFDQARYDATLRACALVKDLQNLDGGDMTEVGEKGVNLSGGQKARISLARAVYSPSPVVLMDDPLSAVDAPTAKYLFEKCICGPLLAGRTRILVTHAEALCAPSADFVVHIAQAGSSSSSMRTRGAATAATLKPSPLSGAVSVASDDSTAEQPAVVANVKRITIDEARSRGSVSLGVYLAYGKAAGGVLFVLLVVLCYFGGQMLFIGNDWWLKTWADAYRHVASVASVASTRLLTLQGSTAALGDSLFSTMRLESKPGAVDAPRPPVNLTYYVGIYALLGFSTIAALFLRVWVVASGSLRASRDLHSRLITKILRAPVQFFEKTPVGRILNRFAKDFKDIDQEVGSSIGDFLGRLISTIVTLLLIIVVTPSTIFGIAPVAAVYVGIGLQYLRSSRELKRMESTTRSPIYSHFGESSTGASTIRAYAAQGRFIDETHELVNNNHKAWFHLWISNRWLGIRIDFSGALVTLASSIAIVSAVLFEGGINPGLAGLSLSYAMAFSDSLLWLIREHASMEMVINSVERAEEYLTMQEEAPAVIPESRPPSSWPASGEIVVSNLTLKYTPESPPVLRNVSFNARPGEKIAIVGRTGAGKTSLSLAFFRFLEHDAGRIVIDGVDISRIGLHDLRSRITIIPQDPVLFSGTLRSNLDPFGECTDQAIWASLKQSHVIESLDSDGTASTDGSQSRSQSRSPTRSASPARGPRPDSPTSPAERLISVDSYVAEGGANFSQGQRQLLCLARALLRRCRLIILDEATASVDHATDARIQQTIREAFADATVLCIAHRLRTVIDMDKVLVLDRGHVAEFGSPAELIRSENGLFRGMCMETGEFEVLVEMAEAAAAARAASASASVVP
ncbi:hypothetical protein BC831DRAFT_508630 [Entophlyctis helioformis]|nr:hypothetical protein BC831DRAFT_508630 [Entophlyctis helioformis]